MASETHGHNAGGVIGIEGAGQFCKATTRAGKRCRAIPLADGFCFAHSPTLADKRRQAQAQGGRVVAERRKLLVGQIDFGSGEAVRLFFESLARAVLRGELPSGRARDCASIAQMALAVRRGAEVEERLAELERLVAALEAHDGE